MITLSEFTVMGMFEAYLLLIGLIASAIFFYRKARRKVNLLRTQLSQLKETTVFLLEKINDGGGGSYKDQLNTELEDTRNHFEKFSPGKEIEIREELSLSSRAVALRYKFLEGELSAQSKSDEWERWEALITNMGSIADELLSNLGSPVKEVEGSGPDKAGDGIDEESWNGIVEATKALIEDNTRENEDRLFDILKAHNSAMELPPIEDPVRQTQTQKRMAQHNKSVDITKMRDSSDQQKQLISSLLSQRNAAESEITVKTEELERLQRYVTESDVCSRLLEDELTSQTNEIEILSKKLRKTDDLNDTLDRYLEENDKMKICIETLETENDDLRNIH